MGNKAGERERGKVEGTIVGKEKTESWETGGVEESAIERRRKG